MIRLSVLAFGLLCALGASCADGLAPQAPGGPEDVLGAPFVVALAGPDLEVLEGSRVVLTGAASRSSSGAPRLTWAQIEGPPVSLTNPSSPTPAFVAPLSPAVLVFELRAEADGGVDVARTTVAVGRRNGPPAGWLSIGQGDVTAEPRTRQQIQLGGVEPGVTVSARSPCLASDAFAIDGALVTFDLPAALPCVVVVEASDATGRSLASAAQAFWPVNTPLPPRTQITGLGGQFIDPDGTASVGYSEPLGPGEVGAFWGAYGGDAVHPAGADGADVVAPRDVETLVIAAERRLGGASGGVTYEELDVYFLADATNVAPVANGGNDRIVLPGTRFRIDASASSDANDDPLTVAITQRLGASAQPVPDLPDVFIAPESTGTLLFHVVVDDGVYASAPAPVRVLVTDTGNNLPPTLVLEPERYVTPGETFIIDASGADDPDSGVISGYGIAQDPLDTDVLLAEPVTTPSVALTALDAGDTYHFIVSAFDGTGTGTSVNVTVYVEDAGPYVDPARGDDAIGNGTAIAPFATVDGARATATRHGFAALLLAEGTHAGIAGEWPAGLSLRGGHRFDVDTYEIAADAVTTLPVVADLTLVDAVASLLVLAPEADASVHLRGAAALHDASVVATAEVRANALVIVDAEQSGRVLRTTIDPAGSSGAPALLVTAGAILDVAVSDVRAALGDATGIACSDATLVIQSSTVTGGAPGAVAARGIDATGCVAVLAGATVSGGLGADATAIRATDTLLSLDASSTARGRDDGSGAGVGISITGDLSPASLAGTVTAGPDGVDVADAVALALVDARVDVTAAVLRAQGVASARALTVAGGTLTLEGATLEAIGPDSVGLALQDASAEVSVIDGGVTATTGISLAVGGGSLTLDGVVVRGATRGVAAGGASLTLIDVDIAADAAALVADAVAVEADDVEAVGGIIAASGENARALIATGATFLERTTLSATAASGTATAVDTTDSIGLESCYVTAAGPTSTAILGRGVRDVVLVHVTARASVAVEVGGDLVLHNCALVGSPSIRTTKQAPFAEAIGLALQDGAPIAESASGTFDTLLELEAAGCDLCFVADVDALIDETGHLVPGANALVSSGDTAVSAQFDIDGEIRPDDENPDLGCDER